MGENEAYPPGTPSPGPERLVLKAASVACPDFARFGRALLPGDRPARPVNEGRGLRRDLARLGGDGRPLALATYDIKGSAWPVAVSLFERHETDQLFVPSGEGIALLVVAPPRPDGQPDPAAARAFIADSEHPFLYAAGTWHAPLVAIGRPGRFLMAMAETGGPDDCRTAVVSPGLLVTGPASDPRIG